MESQGRAQCFARAESNRYAAWALRHFQHTLSLKRRNRRGRMVSKYQRWYSLSLSLVVQPCHVIQSAGTGYNDEPRWRWCPHLLKRNILIADLRITVATTRPWQGEWNTCFNVLLCNMCVTRFAGTSATSNYSCMN
ncbi:uncharacterized protein MELLADRAFT_111731 [Melampsora larici-populina 98AG31]|uniref:Uncharacterized protein n=1 Tax=Melampsora larici-populina (strain 98AG31 / pathotype 3-4-7) TaxID=747676 RepID=F4S4C7_MELLP|nr:uncharacterized protein MELLADRAFT_111731 [Melampsora larici-populina 98AG31]EGG00503.1 hypothetical protein MELLADRAFT_111731 [Melampsora larici-populina 98AG31]